MSINITGLTDVNVGRWVEYCNGGGETFCLEKGRIKSWNHKWVFVVYKCNNNWDEFRNYTTVATNPKDLFFCQALKGE